MTNNIIRAERNGYTLCTRSEFERDATPGLLQRANDAAIGNGGYSCVLWGQHDDDDGFFYWSARVSPR